MDVIFNFSRYEELRQSVLQLLQENMDADLLYEEAEDLFDAWWESQQANTGWSEDAKKRAWQALTEEFMPAGR